MVIFFYLQFSTEITIQTKCQGSSNGTHFGGIFNSDAKMYAKIWVDCFPPRKFSLFGLVCNFHDPCSDACLSEAQGSLCRGHCGCQGQIRSMVGLNGLIDGFCGERQIEFVNVNLKFVWYLSTKRESNFEILVIDSKSKF